MPSPFAIQGSRLTRLDPATGEARWTTDTGLPAVLWANGDLSPSLVLVSDHAGRLVTLDATTGAPLARYDGLDSLSLANAVDPTGQFVASSVFGGGVDLWEARAGVRVGRIALDEAAAVEVTFAPDGLSLTARSPTRVARWSPPVLRRVDRHGCPSSYAAASPDGSRLLLQGREGQCVVDLVGDAASTPLPPGGRVWTGDGGLLDLGALPDGPLGPYASTAAGSRELADPSGGWLARDARGVVRVTRAGERIRLPNGTPVAANGRWLVSAGDTDVVVSDLRTGAIQARLPAEVRTRLLAEVAVWGDRVVAGRFDGSLALWDLPAAPTPDAPAAPPSRTLPGPGAPVSVVVGAGDRLLVGHGDGSFEVYDLDLRVVASGHVWDDLVTSLAVDASGERLLVGVGHASFAVWHLPSGRAITAVTRERRGSLHTLGWTARGDVWGAGADGAWTWAVPPAPAEPLTLTNLRVCEGSLTVVPVASPPVDSPWAPPGGACR